MANVSASASSVSFPASESSSYPAPSSYQYVNRSTHLPFRRISIPSAPNLLNRQSVVSVASFDSLPEERDPALAERNGIRKSKGRPPSLDAIGKRKSRRNVRPVDEAKEAKRLKVIHEFHDTEKAYVDGLDLIYSHFLTPIITSLDNPHPLLSRDELTSVFSNFIDIWNFHRSFISSLSTLMTSLGNPSPISPTLLSHFPYLSLYTPFVTSFPAAMSSLTSLLSTNAQFSLFIAQQESDSRCGRLKLRDWLLTIVQRCPRYLLLLKDLIGCTEPDDPEYTQLVAVHALVSKITISLNMSLHTHSQTLALLALQRNTQNLPIQLITPGRTFLKRGSLLQVERSSSPNEREFLLFSDCLIWLANVEKRDGDLEEWGWEPTSNDKRKSMGFMGVGPRPQMVRVRSKSEAQISSAVKARDSDSSRSKSPTSDTSLPASPTKKKVRQGSSGAEEKWVFKGRSELVDLDVVVTPPRGDGKWRFELLSPEASFAVYASTEEERDEWSIAIRHAKLSLLISLNAMHPNSTLTSSASTHHLRRSLQALPHSPEDDSRKPKRGKVEHFVPAIWIPDAKTESCMRCGRPFSWRRRRHHCRLCGRCICASCSAKTFVISDSASGTSTKSARSCNSCYDTVFPLLDSPKPQEDAPLLPQSNSVSGLPSWLSMPSFTILPPVSTPDALMSIGIGSPNRALHRIDDREDDNGEEGYANGQPETPIPRMRMKSPRRPRSYYQIPEDFQSAETGLSDAGGSPPMITRQHKGLLRGRTKDEITEEPRTITNSSPSRQSFDEPITSRKEDTARRHKRFSLPAVALHTAPVTVQPSPSPAGNQKSLLFVPAGRSGDRQAQSEVSYDGQRLADNEPDNGGVVAKLSELLGRR